MTCTDTAGMMHVTLTSGWSATSGQVDNWVYEDANDVYMKDEEMQKRLMETNPNSFRKMVANFLEANGRGYWETSEENIDRLRQLYMEAGPYTRPLLSSTPTVYALETIQMSNVFRQKSFS